MKKLFLLLLGIGLLASCQKKMPNAPDSMQSVTFGVHEIDASNLKSDIVTWDCSTVNPDRAWIQIDGINYYAHLTMVNGKLYSQSIKLTPGSHTVTHFVLYRESDGVEGITGSDVIVYGIPEAGSDFAIYVDKPVEFSIDVSSFEKTEVSVEVLCFDESVYTKFGYDWFVINRTVVREQCFFGDLCTEDYMNYTGSNYENQSTGLALDMPAIFKIKAYEKQSDGSWTLLANGGIFTNNNAESGWGVGAPVCVQYSDKLGVVDSLKFELYLLVKQDNTFGFKLYYTWLFADDEKIPAGEDGVVDFELGDCNASSVDLQLQPNDNPIPDPNPDPDPEPCTLPDRAFLEVENAAHGTVLTQEGLPGYFDLILSGIEPGHCLINGRYAGNSLSRRGSVTFNAVHEVYVRSSLHPELMGNKAKSLPWDKANWLINHLADYPGHTWSDIQQALWMLEDPHYNGNTHGGNYDPDPITAIGLQMVADANLYGSGYVPGTGDLVALVFESVHGNSVTSLFIRYAP